MLMRIPTLRTEAPEGSMACLQGKVCPCRNQAPDGFLKADAR